MDEPFSELAMLLGRAFYEDLEVIVLDKLVLLRQSLTDRELAEVLHLSEKHVRKALVPLLRDRLVSKVTRKLADVDATTATAAEYREHQRTLGEQTSYSIELSLVPDFAKYKLHSLRKHVEQGGKASGGGAGDEAVAWRCARCELSFSEDDAWALYDRDRQVFTCDGCGLPIEQAAADEAPRDQSSADERRRRFEAAIAPLLVAIGRCDKEIEEGRDAPALLRPRALGADVADGAEPGAGDRAAGARAAGAAGARGDGGAREAPADGQLSLTVEMGASATPAVCGAAVSGAAAAAAPLFWQAGASEEARKRTRDEEAAAEAAAAAAAQAARDEHWAAELKANQERQQRELARTGRAPLAQPAPAPPAPPDAAGGAARAAALAAPDVDDGDEWEGEEEDDDVRVTVQGVPKRLSEVTDEDMERMTSDEYQLYYARSQA
ncbi:hypothetical protein KFE25_010124 [Diacronema lutheri]|uniref:Transcription initiation factor IIE subunit alpha N-terminal domain-containing protein n=1 Tax=Diacronema lutheri TaxID=2081491 RepID=A0A8J5XA79_DIALT|nr:hypothetical protein KFE25_010124 [Diacronema lutheri]